MTKEISLTRGKVTIIDDEDYEWVSKYKWYSHESTNNYYAATYMHRDGKKQITKLHRLIAGATDPGQIVDHINRNSLDNRRSNLRIGNSKQNLANRRVYDQSTQKRRLQNRLDSLRLIVKEQKARMDNIEKHITRLQDQINGINSKTNPGTELDFLDQESRVLR